MAKRCANCDQLLLEDEWVCWQCGYRLSDVPAGTLPQTNAQPTVSLILPATTIYTVTLIVMIVMALWLTAILGNRPLVQANTTDRPPAGWFIFTNDDHIFTLFLPEAWTRYEAIGLPELVASDPFYQEALQPLGKVASDVQPLLLVVPQEAMIATRPEAFLLVAQSTTLAQLTLTEAKGQAEGRPGVVEATVVDDFDKSHLFINWATADGSWSCLQQFVTALGRSLLLVACSPNPSPHKASLNLMLANFQSLHP